MRMKETAIQRAAKNAGLDITLQDMVDGVEDEFLVIDSEYRVRLTNSAVRSRLRKRAKSPIGRRCYEVFYDRDRPCGAPLWDCPLRKVLDSGAMATIIHPDHALGSNKYLKITAYPLRDSSGNTTAIVEMRRDVTAERELESQILRRHHQLLALSHISGAVSGLWDLDAILRIALDNVLEIINGDIGGILLLDEETETLRYRMQRGLSAKYADEIRMRMGEGIGGRVAQTGEPMLLEDISQDPRAIYPDLISAEGLKGFISIPLKAKDKVVGVMNLASHVAGRFGTDDISLLSSISDYLGTAIEQARLYARLASAGERYQTLLQHALSTQEEERKRIARELHDETSQALTSLTLNLQAIIQMAEMKGVRDTELMEKLKATHSYAIHAGNEVVKLMKELRPTLLDELGLPAAIHRYAKDTLQAQGIEVSAEFIDTEERLPPEVEVTLFRVAQGVIGNILEHSMAKNASIKLSCSASECLLRIEDDGKGFNVSKITRVDPSGRGAGVFTMKERVKLVGGVCHIESRPGKGTRVVVKVPLGKDMANEEDKGANSR
ncbi:MAG: GAF domain-containing protein [Dehalococcoidia bacterium]|nr:MAG: GAF domain-containing protein [Dehalococcoidia bacterium]